MPVGMTQQGQFDIAQAFDAPYNKLLNTLFPPVATDLTVIPSFQEIKGGGDYFVTFENFLENRPCSLCWRSSNARRIFILTQYAKSITLVNKIFGPVVTVRYQINLLGSHNLFTITMYLFYSISFNLIPYTKKINWFCI